MRRINGKGARMGGKGAAKRRKLFRETMTLYAVACEARMLHETPLTCPRCGAALHEAHGMGGTLVCTGRDCPTFYAFQTIPVVTP